MSTYCCIEGEINYNEEDFQKVRNILEKGGWIDGEGVFIDEAGDQICRDFGAFDDGNNKVLIPNHIHRNLNRVSFLNYFTPSAVGYVKGTCTDGEATGWYHENIFGQKIREEYGLIEFAQKHGMGSPPKDADEYLDWIDSVVVEFHHLMNVLKHQ